jgi:hypothetical protein
MQEHREDHQDRHQINGPDELRGSLNAQAAEIDPDSDNLADAGFIYSFLFLGAPQ